MLPTPHSAMPGAINDRSILYLITTDLSARFLRGQLAFLQANGFDITVGVNLCDSTTDIFDVGVRVADMPYVREPHVLRDIRALVATIRLVRSVRPQIVNASTPKAGMIGMLSARMSRVPVRVYVVRGLRYETATGNRRRFLRTMERVSVRCATHVIFNSKSTRAVAESDGVISAGRGIVLGAGSGNGIDATRFGDLPSRSRARADLEIDDDAPVIGFIGRLTRDKGITDLLDAFVAVRSRNPGVQLLLVGSVEDGDPLGPLTLNRIVQDPDIHHVPWTNETGRVYRAIDVLAFPSYREGLPNVPLEAQFCGVPVVGYAASGTVDAVQDRSTGILVPTGDVAALAKAIENVLDDPQLGARLGVAGHEWVSTAFRPESLWATLSELYIKWASGI